MTLSNYWSAILAKSSRILRLSDQLTSRYENIPEIITREHAAITANNLVELQQTCQEKSDLGELVALDLEEFRLEVDALFLHTSMRIEILHPESRGHREIIALFDSLLEHAALLGIAPEEIQKVRGQLTASFAAFRAKFEIIQPIIECNRTVIRTMLDHQQQSFRFWAEIVQEESSSYNASGSRKSKGGGSLINIQA